MHRGRAGLVAAATTAVLLALVPAGTSQSSTAAEAPSAAAGVTEGPGVPHTGAKLAAGATTEHPPAPPATDALTSSLLGVNYYYASAQSQYARTRGAKAKFTVHTPSQVRQAGDHSLAEIAIRGPHQSDIIEAGWRTDYTGVTRLFVYYWVNGQPACYNGCGFKAKGNGIKPGTPLQPGTKVKVKWKFKKGKWKLKVDGKLSGFYKKKLWNGRFRRSSVIQVFGEVATKSLLPCADMGSGIKPWRRDAAMIKAKFVKGPDIKLRQNKVAALNGYGLKVVNDKKIRYGGQGSC